MIAVDVWPGGFLQRILQAAQLHLTAGRHDMDVDAQKQNLQARAWPHEPHEVPNQQTRAWRHKIASFVAELNQPGSGYRGYGSAVKMQISVIALLRIDVTVTLTWSKGGFHALQRAIAVTSNTVFAQ